MESYTKTLAKLSGDNALIVCFDDLERASMPVVKMLGHLNPYVEHLGAKVIILCHEGEILSNKGKGKKAAEAYRRSKEKVIRITRTYGVDHANVVDAIVDEHSKNEAYHEYLKKHKPSIIQLFKSSKLDNLRILKYGLGVLEMAFNTVHSIAKNDESRLTGLLWTLLPLTFELQAARLTIDDARQVLTDGPGVLYGSLYGSEDDNSTPLDQYSSRYSIAEHYNSFVISDSLADLVATGYLDVACLQQEVEDEIAKDSPLQQAIKEFTNSWHDLEDDRFDKLLLEIVDNVRIGNISDWKELVRIAQIADAAVQNGIVSKDRRWIRNAYKVGVNALVKNDTFVCKEGFDSTHGMIIFDDGGRLVRWTRGLLLKTNRVLRKETLTQNIRAAFDNIENDAITFGRLLYAHDIIGIWDQPIDEYISPEEFSEKYTGCSNCAKRQIASSMHSRYNQDINIPKLVKDVTWLGSVNNRLQEWLKEHAGTAAPSRLNVKQMHQIIETAICKLKDHISHLTSQALKDSEH